MSNKKHFKSAICVVLTLVLVVCGVLSVTAFDADISDTGVSGTVYYKNNTNWGDVYCYMWNGDGSQKNADWPGQKMTFVESNIYKYETTTSYDNVIFNNGSGGTGNQTSDLQFSKSGQIYDGSTWYDYVIDPTTPSEEPSSTTPSTDGEYVYCENAASWGDVYCYMWKNGAGENSAWPGVKMENIGENIYRYKFPSTFDMIIFNNGGSTQTGDMTFPGANKIYNNSTSEWKDYDTSPISVKSFKTDADGTVYKNMELTVSASATSTGGTVYYKYSVTNGSNTTVLKDFSTATSVKWTPTTAGTYTLVCDFKDAANNENQRKLTVTVADDASVAEPIIKKVTPGTYEVKNNTNMNIAVTAGGGKVGTNLLFYKYTVKDSAGNIVNVPYYTKNASYTYKPTKLGKFTVTVSVQNSKNAVTERTLEFNSVTNPVEPDDPDVPITGVLGDADGDGVLSVLDATEIQRYVAQLITEADFRYDLSDFDKDSKVSIMDATAIQYKLASMG